MPQQLELFTDENIQVSHIVEANGRDVLMHYRVSRVTTLSTSQWDYRPDFSTVWTPVNSQHIRLLLDAGEHPRNFERAYALQREHMEWE